MTLTANMEHQDVSAPRRRVDDFPLPGQPLDWSDAGTPLESTSVVYLYRPTGERFVRWAEIRTQEHLLDVQAAPDRFVVRTLFTVPVDELSRSPTTLVAMAQTKLDRIQAATGKVIANFRAAMAEIGGQA